MNKPLFNYYEWENQTNVQFNIMCIPPKNMRVKLYLIGPNK